MKEINKYIDDSDSYDKKHDDEVIVYWHDEHGNYYPLTRRQARNIDDTTKGGCLCFIIFAIVSFFIIAPLIGYLESGWEGIWAPFQLYWGLLKLIYYFIEGIVLIIIGLLEAIG